jgi:hypothetical protein
VWIKRCGYSDSVVRLHYKVKVAIAIAMAVAVHNITPSRKPFQIEISGHENVRPN